MRITTLKEARNVGEWLEARIHLMFTEIADGMFGDGRLTRDERITLSSAIGDALDAFRGKIESAAATLYQRDPYAEPEMDGTMMEAGLPIDEPIELIEAAAVRRDGTIYGKIIEPGWGSSGYYPADVLERDGPIAYSAGTHMFWNHATATEEAERPEGDLDNLAAVLVDSARWDANGPKGPGLYANAKVFKDFADKINDKAEFTGLSIRGGGSYRVGEAEGRKGKIITAINNGVSVDFVTKAGAGGSVVIAEAAQHKQLVEEQIDVDEKLKEAQERGEKLLAENARLQEALTLRDATDYVRQTLSESTLPDVTKARLLTQLAANPPVKDGALDKETYAARIAEAVTAETTYLQQVAGYGAGRIEGMGGGQQTTPTQASEAESTDRMVEAFRNMGMSEAEAKIAAAGRMV